MKSFSALLVTTLLTLFGLSGSVATSETSWEKYRCKSLNQMAANAKVLDQSSYDVVIYGGTPSAVAAARTAAELGKTVLILSESGLFGGAISNGLSATDLDQVEANTGLAATYLNDLQDFYHSENYRTEPKVAECIFLSWLTDPKITLGTNTVLDGATVIGKKITDISFHSGTNSYSSSRVFGKTFIDASYAGDLMFRSGVETRLGMKDFYDYHERVTKVRKYSVLFRLKDENAIEQAASDFAKLPPVELKPSLKNYKKDILEGMPSFTYRLCLTKDDANKIPFTKTADYQTYAPAWRTFMQNYIGFKIQQTPQVNPNGTVLTQLWRLAKIPNNKWDLNASYSSFSNLIMPREYFDHPENRVAILNKYKNYLKSFLYFVQHDASVPNLEKQALADFGLCADEFVSNAGWPQQPYLREGRRLVGKTTLTTKDIFFKRTKKDGVAAATYALDSKPALFTYANGMFARDKAEMYRVPVYEIGLSSMLPKSGPKNLVVSVGISASPTAYSSIRMEPQFIQLGQAAGIAAALAASGKGIISNKLATQVKLELVKVRGFASIRSICWKLHKDTRPVWGFNPETCETVPVGLKVR